MLMLPMLLLLAASAAAAECPPTARRILPGTAIQPIVALAPAGTAFCLGAGEHRLQSITPKDRQQFFGEPGTVLNGAKLVIGFERLAGAWITKGQHQKGLRWHPDACLPEWPRCAYPEAVFIDDQPLRHVGSAAAVTAGTFFLDYATDRLYLADDPGGRRVEASVAPYAFLGGARQVTIQGLTVEKYATPLQYGAIGYNRPSGEWLLRDNEVRLNHGSGIVVGNGSRVLSNHIHGNGQIGMGCVGRDVLIEGNEIAWNGYFSGVNVYWEGGGGKCAITTRLIVRGNHLHHNNGMGFWTDIDNIYSLYEGNLVEHNSSGGLSHEISYDSVIRNNTLTANGPADPLWLWGGAIQVQNSRNVTVEGNTIDTTEGGNGICLIQQDRGTGRYGPWVTTGNRVYRNHIVSHRYDRGISGAIADHDPAGMAAGKNEFNQNTYDVINAQGRHWAWVDGFFGWSDYRRHSGQDSDSIIHPPVPADEKSP